ncbi:MAG: tetratricopeptide repeat protein [Deltaproteobacteria bacterium]|nr:tetratricopeptide repeat protein [Deltaproteobacteria bacterium]
MALGDTEQSVAAAKRALALRPDYPPAVLTMGSIEYQRRRENEGRRLFLSLLSLPENDCDIREIIDVAGSFLIRSKEYADGLDLFRGAVERFPDRSNLYQGLGCCAAHEGFLDEAVAAYENAFALEPNSQELTNDLGWSLYESGRLERARELLLRAVSMDSSDELARENLRICEQGAF